MEPSNTQLLGCGWTQPAQCPPTFFMICPPPANAGGQAQAQFPTIPVFQCVTTGCTGIPFVCNSGQGQAQAQTMYQTQVGCMVSVPPHCPTVAPMCPPQPQNTTATVCTQIGCPPPAGADAGPAQAQFPTWPPAQCIPHSFACITLPPTVCLVTNVTNIACGGQAQAQTMYYTQVGCPVSVPPHCPTVAPMCPPQQQNTAATVCTQIGCPPPAGGDTTVQAQAQFPTWPINQCIPHTLSCLTIPPTLCLVTQIAGCGGAQAQAQTAFPTLPPMCPMTSPPMCPATIACPPAAGSGQAQAQAQPPFRDTAIWLNCPTHVACTFIGCPAPGGNAGQPQFPQTLLGCVVTQTPFCHQTSFPKCPPVFSAVTHCPTVAPMCPVTQFHCQLSAPPHCPTVGACPPNTGGQNQAQAQIPTLPVFDCVTRGCTGIPFVC